MTPEEISKNDAKIQNELWVKVEKLACRKAALEYAKKCCNSNIPKYLLENADEIYDWLIKEL